MADRPPINRLIRLSLVHDMAEIYAGDTFAFVNDDALRDKKAREAAALQRLRHEWTDFPELTQTIEEYEHRQAPEAAFVHALDKIMPILLNYLTKGVVWREKGITLEKFIAEKERKIPQSSPSTPTTRTS